MAPLIVIPELPQLAQSVEDALPSLPALAELLRMADKISDDGSWRRGLLGDLGATHLTGVAPASVAAAAAGLAAGTAVCIASPVHAVAGMNRVHLHATGVLALSAEERLQLAEGFTAQFGPAEQLHAAGDEWLLATPAAAAAADGDPQDWAGAPLQRAASDSAGQRALRRLGAEIEIWLTGLPLNRERERRGRLPVNSLWLWGGGVAGAPAGHTRPLRLHATRSDAWIAGLAALHGVESQAPPQGWEALQPSRTHADVVVLTGVAQAGAAALAQWDAAWFAPALQDLQAQRLDRLNLRLGAQAWESKPRWLQAPWRRAQPWWQWIRS